MSKYNVDRMRKMARYFSIVFVMSSLLLICIYIYTFMYTTAQWNSTYNVGYVARRKDLRCFCTNQLRCVITFAGMSVTNKCYQLSPTATGHLRSMTTMETTPNRLVRLRSISMLDRHVDGLSPVHRHRSHLRPSRRRAVDYVRGSSNIPTLLVVVPVDNRGCSR